MNEELSDLDLMGLLDRLAPIPEPPAVSLWPQTAGWIWVGFFFGIGTIWLIRMAMIRWRANAYRRAALREIAAADGMPAVLAEILRRTALVAFSRSEVAGLHGGDWLEFLDRSGGASRGAESRAFRDGIGSRLARAPYDSEASWSAQETEEAKALCIGWIRHHRRERESAS